MNPSKMKAQPEMMRLRRVFWSQDLTEPLSGLVGQGQGQNTDFTDSPDWLPLKNGVINLRTGKFVAGPLATPGERQMGRQKGGGL